MNSENMLIRDPYLSSDQKQYAFKSEVNRSYPTPSLTPDQHTNREVQDLKHNLQKYQQELKDMQQAYNSQEIIARKVLNYQQTTNQYHEAMKHRNLELNTKVKDIAYEAKLLHQKHEEDQYRQTYDKDMLLTKYQDQCQDVIALKRNLNLFLDQKTHLEEEIHHLTFLLEKEASQSELQLKEQIIRMENMERTYKNMISVKDQEIGQLHHRLRVYEDENKRLNDFNKTLQLTKIDKIDNLSQIHHPESNIKIIEHDNKENSSHFKPKMHSYQKEREREEFKEREREEFQRKDEINELKQQKQLNFELRKQLELLKNGKNRPDEHDKVGSNLLNQPKHKQHMQSNHHEDNENGQKHDVFQQSQAEGLINSVITLRNGINKEIFDVFFRSVKDGEKNKQNSLVIFIQNWKCVQIERIQPYIESYLQTRNNLKVLGQEKKVKKSLNVYTKIQECIPLHLGSKAGRNNINEWVLSTIQFTKNQRESSKKSLNNSLLFLFRLLTIEYRIRYPMQGKSYTIDEDVRNELKHQIIKAITYIVQFQ